MKLTPNIQKAINIASEKHLGQVRKADGLPYIVHPFAVAWILSNYTGNEDVIVAGLLHDVLEDVESYKFDDLKNDLGGKVANIVRELSEEREPSVEIDAKATWRTRKKQYLERLQSASVEALMVCAADKIHNLLSIIDAYEKFGNPVWAKFDSPINKKMHFYGEVLKLLEQRLDNGIVIELTKTYTETKNKLVESGINL